MAERTGELREEDLSPTSRVHLLRSVFGTSLVALQPITSLWSSYLTIPVVCAVAVASQAHTWPTAARTSSGIMVTSPSSQPGHRALSGLLTISPLPESLSPGASKTVSMTLH